MKLNRYILFILMLLIVKGLRAQDIHFTQFNYVPLSINPAQTGHFEGSYRIGGLYRGQWFGGVKNGFQTPVLYVDLPIAGFRKQDWIGIGINGHRDAAGSSLLTNTVIGIHAAYHVGLDKKQTKVFSIGFSAGFAQRNIDKTRLTFQDGILSGGNSADIPLINADNKSYTDFNIGVNFKNKISKTQTLNMGLSAEHFLSPKTNLISTGLGELPLRLNLYGSMEVALDKKQTKFLYPAVIFRTQSGSGSEIMAQAVGGLKLDPKKDMILKAGLGYRLGDAAQAILGIQMGDFKAGLAYDFTLNDLRTSASTKDGFEIAVGYVGRIFRTPQPPRVILCPKY
jgi:type IX secretion system PorP/SprF family membrane protein